MEKKEQLLNISPQHELKFHGPFNLGVTSFIKLSNPTDKSILFKIKTTAPKKYCVRPNSGVILPNRTAEVAINLQPFTFDPNEKNKHKFMVQSLVAPEFEYNDEQLWKEVSQDQIMDSKLRCVFEIPAENSITPSAAATTSAALIKNESNTADIIQAGGDDKSVEGSTEFAKATAEMRQLREEESQLRQENLQLKEQLLRLRTSEGLVKEKSSSSSSVPSYQNTYSPPVANEQIPMLYVAIAIVMAFVGLFLGKFVL